MKARTRTATAAGGVLAASALLTACGAGGGDGYGNAAGGLQQRSRRDRFVSVCRARSIC